MDETEEQQISDPSTTDVHPSEIPSNGKAPECKEDVEIPEATKCGIGPYNPQCLQIFASKKFFTFMLCIFGLIEGALISAVVVSVIVISYFGEKAHKPRWIGIAFFTQGIGALVFALPHFIFGKYDAGSVTNTTLVLESCNNPSLLVPDCDAGNTGAYILFLINGNAIIGVSAAPLFTIGVSFIDDIVLPKYVSLHIGAFQVCTIVGPAIGFGIGSVLLTLNVDVGEVTNLTEDDPAWVGAWWLSFIVGAVVSFLFSIPFFFFPRVLPDTHLVTEARQKQMKETYKSRFGEEKTFVEQLKAFPFHLLGLFKSKAWLFLTLGTTFLFLSLEALVSFAPKYVETVYRVPASTAGLIIGAMAIAAGGIGTLTGALIAHCVKIGKNLGIVNWVTVLIAVVFQAGFFLTCPSVDVVGIGTQYTNNSISNSSDVLLASCNTDCGCSSTIFEPVCGADGLTYFSPCRASCQQIGDIQNVTYENCGCVAANLRNNMMDSDFGTILANSTATRGLCPLPCSFLLGWIVMVTISVILIFLIRVPFLLVTLRSVADEQRTFALGVQSLFFRLFGSIPGPLLFGAIIDSGCVYSQTECGRIANCWVYDNNILRLRAYIFCTFGILACLVCTVLSWVFYPPYGFKLAPPDGIEDKCQDPPVDGKLGAPNPVFIADTTA
ncbi:solute carrier organic anion transporter family member 4A1-like isoform X2 [Halichondria panicea]|uniref:solute carrier organic anion transporter family member 4A1-like isoform X2 n=1 Tax=Halichondria panicea TaxID=6063 RepID=UPI00312B8CAF